MHLVNVASYIRLMMKFLFTLRARKFSWFDMFSSLVPFEIDFVGKYLITLIAWYGFLGMSSCNVRFKVRSLAAFFVTQFARKFSFSRQVVHLISPISETYQTKKSVDMLTLKNISLLKIQGNFWGAFSDIDIVKKKILRWCKKILRWWEKYWGGKKRYWGGTVVTFPIC